MGIVNVQQSQSSLPPATRPHALVLAWDLANSPGHMLLSTSPTTSQGTQPKKQSWEAQAPAACPWEDEGTGTSLRPYGALSAFVQ